MAEPHTQLTLGGFAGNFNRRGIREQLRSMDAYGWETVDAVAPVGSTTTVAIGAMSFVEPQLYLGSDGVPYWVKYKAQTGLGAELIATRQAEMLGVGAHPLVVDFSALAQVDGTESLLLGISDRPNTVASKELSVIGLEFLGRTRVDMDSWAMSSVFQSWTDVMDPQILVDRATGQVISLDHGEAFRWLEDGPPRPMVARLPGLSLNWSETYAAAMEMVFRIEALSVDDIVRTVAGVPNETRWQAPLERRVAIAHWLLKRRPLLREQVTRWARAYS